MISYKQLQQFSESVEPEKDQFTVGVIKGLIMDGVRRADSGHSGGTLSSADMAYILWKEFLNFNPDDPDWFPRDRFVLSAGHESMLLYALLHLAGWMDLEELKRFRQLGSQTPGHPEVETPGVEATTGPLGQGVAMAVGLALAEEILKAQIPNNETDDHFLGHYTYVLAGDGDLQEPVALGAAALAGHWNLQRLVMLYDSNKAQISGSTSRSDSADIRSMFEGMGWHVQKVDGHDHEELRTAIQTGKVINRPGLIICNTVMASGTITREGDYTTHGAPLPQNEIAATKEALGLPQEEFWVPDEAINHFRSRFEDLRDRANTWNTDLEHRLEKRKFAEIWDIIIHGKYPELELPEFEDGTSLATRKAFGVTLESFARLLPTLVGGSADLEPSNYTGGFAQAYGDFQADNRSGRNLAFGVREFPMAAIMNGLALHGGIIPFGGTFLVFSDYERPALRLAALQKVHVIHEFTHDSFYVGEDGPTHQPIEQTMSLRLIPGFSVFRPADARETAACFKLALEQKDAPSALLLSRQGLPVLPLTSAAIERGTRKGAYAVVREPDPEIVLIATGSEVSLALETAEKLNDRRIRVVSMPNRELFQNQSKRYRETLIPPRGCLKVSLEAGVTNGWEGIVGPSGLSIGIDRFGASAPAGDLAETFGFTADRVVKKIQKHIRDLL